jgi:hypothetical protein
MKQQFEAALTGLYIKIDGNVKKVNFSGFDVAYEFASIDNTIHLTIAKNDGGNWQRVGGTEPYLSSWIDELAKQIV